MNRPAIPFDALNRFRNAASQYARSTKSRASRLLALKDDIAALRKRGVSYRAISELLTQSGITASDTCVMNFCHRTLKERRRKPSATRHATQNTDSREKRDSAMDAKIKTATPVTLPVTVSPSPVPVENTTVKTRGPHIAKVELLKPDEQYD